MGRSDGAEYPMGTCRPESSDGTDCGESRRNHGLNRDQVEQIQNRTEIYQKAYSRNIQASLNFLLIVSAHYNFAVGSSNRFMKAI